MSSNLSLEWKGVGQDAKTGIHKHWAYDSEATYQIVCDYLQKIRFSVEDIDNALNSLKFDNQTITFLVTAVDWIVESTRWISEAINKDVKSNFCFTKLDEYKKVYDYFKAIRSFLVAHPLNTENHKKFSLDGTYICMDVRNKNDSVIILLENHEECFRYIDYDGMHLGKSKRSDFYLSCYSQEFHENRFTIYIGICLEDILKTAKLAIEKVYELDSYLSKLKKKEFER